MAKLTKAQIEMLAEVRRFDRSGYHLGWKPKTIAKLEELGFVARSGAGHRITDSGRQALSEGEQK